MDVVKLAEISVCLLRTSGAEEVDFVRPESRRQFITRLGATAIATAGANISFWQASLLAQEKSAANKSYPSHGPTKHWLENSRELIANLILPPPKGRRLNDHVFVSTRLENVFYLNLGERAVLIDTGFDHQADSHLDNFKRLGCDLAKIAVILATHSHVDHTGGLKRAQQRLDVPIVAHRHAVEPIGKGDLLRTAAVIPEIEGWRFQYPACKVDQAVDDRDVIQVDDERIVVLHIPGHNPDCLGYLWRQHFFTGDAVFGGGLIGWANERWLSNYQDHADSMKRLVASPPDAETFYAAHGSQLPYKSKVPNDCLKTLDRLIRRKGDPCNNTPRTQRRDPSDLPQIRDL